MATTEQRQGYNRRYYEKTKEVHNPSRYARRQAERELVREFVRDYKEHNPCADCGRFYPYYVMDFDLIGVKFKNVSAMMGHSMTRVKEEISQCVLRCSNCHRIRTHQRMGH
jgi:hypothetical protein